MRKKCGKMILKVRFSVDDFALYKERKSDGKVFFVNLQYQVDVY